MSSETTTNTALLKQAGDVIAGALGASPEKTTIVTTDRIPNNTGVYVEKHSPDATYTIITTQLPDAVLDTKTGTKDILAKLSAVPAIKAKEQLKPDTDLAEEIKAKIETVTAGTEFDKNLLKSPLLDKAVLEKSWQVGDHMVRYHPKSPHDNGAYGVQFTLNTAAETTEKSEELSKQLVAIMNTAEVKSEFQAALAKRIVKNAELDAKNNGKTLSDTERTELEANAKNLQVFVNEAQRYDGGIRVSIRSPKQIENHPKGGDEFAVPDNAVELKATNPLQQLPDTNANPLVQKAIAGALLDVPAIKAQAHLVMGRADMGRALTEEFARLNMTGKDEVKAILESDLFKKRTIEYGEKPDSTNAKPAPDINIEGNKVTIVMDLPSEKMPQFIKDIAIGTSTTADQQPAIANATTQTAIAADMPQPDAASALAAAVATAPSADAKTAPEASTIAVAGAAASASPEASAASGAIAATAGNSAEKTATAIAGATATPELTAAGALAATAQPQQATSPTANIEQRNASFALQMTQDKQKAAIAAAMAGASGRAAG